MDIDLTLKKIYFLIIYFSVFNRKYPNNRNNLRFEKINQKTHFLKKLQCDTKLDNKLCQYFKINISKLSYNILTHFGTLLSGGS